MVERTRSSSYPWTGRRVRVRVDEVTRADGRQTTREIVEHPGAVAILAWDGSRIVMVRQWRHATGQRLLEIPAGTLEPGEPPIETAKRELAEEAGLGASSWEAGPEFYTAPGFCDERMRIFLATSLHAATGEPDEDEDLELSWMTLDDALAALDDGRILDAKTLAAVGWLARRLRPGGS